MVGSRITGDCVISFSLLLFVELGPELALVRKTATYSGLREDSDLALELVDSSVDIGKETLLYYALKISPQRY